MSVTSQIEQQARERLEELAPLVEEHRQLEAVLAAFEAARNETAAPASTPAPRRPAGRKRGAATKSRKSAGARSAATSGGRAAQAYELVSARPGITVQELADALGIGPTYLYRLMPALDREGRVRKEGNGYHAV